MKPAIALFACLFLPSLMAQAGEPPGADAEIVTVRTPQEIMSKQKLPYFVGISGDSAGAQGLSMNLVMIPPGGQADAHYHDGFESAIYVIQGKVETRYGRGLKKSVINQAGDFLYIPPNLPHQPRNLSDSEPAIAIVARNDPNEQESVVPYSVQPEAGAKAAKIFSPAVATSAPRGESIGRTDELPFAQSN